MTIEIKLPDLGDGIDSGDVLEVLVSVGDTIAKDQGIVELETDKATVEVPSSHEGTVTEILVKEGQSLKIGETIIKLDPAGSSGSQQAAQTPEAAPSAATPETAEPVAAKPEAPVTPPEPAPPAVLATSVETPVPAATPPVTAAPTAVAAPPASEPSSGDIIPAGPAVRRFAREVGVDLSRVSGSGPNGRITREDVLGVVRQASQASQTSQAVQSGGAAAPSAQPRSDRPGDAAADNWGPVRLVKMTKIRRTIAQKMHESWTTVPRVTNFDDADVTELERIRQSSKADYAHKGIKLTSMPFLIKAVAMALREHPEINASVDMEQGQIIYKDYVNVGIAVDTDRGLVVPALRSADQLSIPGIAHELAAIADKARSGNFAIEDLRGGTFTISNLGAVGGQYSTPIINVPEVAILLVGRSEKRPVVINDEIAIRLVMPLSLSYDHRLVDGATAARFLNDVIAYLEMPSRLLLAP